MAGHDLRINRESRNIPIRLEPMPMRRLFSNGSNKCRIPLIFRVAYIRIYMYPAREAS